MPDTRASTVQECGSVIPKQVMANRCGMELSTSVCLSLGVHLDIADQVPDAAGWLHSAGHGRPALLLDQILVPV
jgi:hypothetical protein